jgi:hypothetical protein
VLPIVFAVLLATPPPAEAVDPLASAVQQPLGHDGLQETFLSRVNAIDRETTITESLLSSFPRWSPESGSPVPLSVSEAVAASRKVLEGSVRDWPTWGISQIALERFHQSWFYVVRWRPIAGGTNESLQVPVLLTGDPVPPDGKSSSQP